MLPLNPYRDPVYRRQMQIIEDILGDKIPGAWAFESRNKIRLDGTMKPAARLNAQKALESAGWKYANGFWTWDKGNWVNPCPATLDSTQPH